ncbi:MAG: transcription/translation regulatory transformer protein RfaH [Oceanospirillaceae bacterium]|nr:transcription/translation regulatory transformer protein RfaH [Oceanospirillaceae bacterium]
MTREQHPAQWLLVATKPRQEKRAAEHLANQSFEVFCPFVMVETIARGKKSVKSEALFPGYLFIHWPQEQSTASVRSTRGVRDIVRFNGEPARVADAIIETIKNRVTELSERPLSSEQLPKPGERVTVIEGPFAGFEAIFETFNGMERAIILLELLGQTQRLTISLRQVTTNR